jgi:hypothetical protein
MHTAVVSAALLLCMWRRSRGTERRFAAELARIQRRSNWLDPRSDEGRRLLSRIQVRTVHPSATLHPEAGCTTMALAH